MSTFETQLEGLLDVQAPKRNNDLWVIRSFFWFLAIIFALLHAWAYRHSMNPDGICYLDIAEAYLKRDWATAINVYWSPLYSWLLGLGLFILKPSPDWEFPVAHLVNFVIFLGSLACFEIFLRALLHRRRDENIRFSQGSLIALPDWALSSLGYTLFIWSSLQLITVKVVAPDLLAAALVFLAASLLLNIQSQPNRWFGFVLLGIVLGLGYLARSFMFQLAFIFLAASLISVGDLRKAFLRVLAALAIFLLVSAPFIAALSKSKERFTVGEQARLRQLFVVNTFSMPSYEKLQDPRHGQPKHPARKVFGRPAVYPVPQKALPVKAGMNGYGFPEGFLPKATPVKAWYGVYEFGTPVGGTYPFNYDVSYWFEGMTPVFNLEQQLRILRSGIRLYAAILFRSLSAFTVGFLILFFVGYKHWPGVMGILKRNPFLVPTLFALAAFLPFFVEGRVAAPFAVLLGMGFFSEIKLLDSQEVRRWINGITVAILTVMAAQLSILMDRELYIEARALIRRERTPDPLHWQVAQGLNQMGIQPGDRVASIELSYGHYWARLARVRIVAEIPSSDDVQYFWASDAETQAQVIRAFESTGARAIVTESLPNFSPPPGWRQVGTTPYYAYLLT